MGYIIGTDEAGYGPNLGPLVISATLWRTAGVPKLCDFYELLAPAVTRTRQASDTSMVGVTMADSKVLYRAGQGLGLLERGVLAAIESTGRGVRSWRGAWRALAPEAVPELELAPWYVEFDDITAPLAADPVDVAQATQALRNAWASSGLSLLAVSSRVVFPAEFNRLVALYGGKGEVLSRLTVELVADQLARVEQEPALAICDKHGGRNRYGELLQRRFPDCLIEVAGESRRASVYRWGPKPNRREVQFCAKGEEHLPVALASMASKYLREIAMLAFNQFWERCVPGLCHTAGYPVDARRFRGQIAQAQRDLGIPDCVLWRER